MLRPLWAPPTIRMAPLSHAGCIGLFRPESLQLGLRAAGFCRRRLAVSLRRGVPPAGFAAGSTRGRRYPACKLFRMHAELVHPVRGSAPARPRPRQDRRPGRVAKERLDQAVDLQPQRAEHALHLAVAFPLSSRTVSQTFEACAWSRDLAVGATRGHAVDGDAVAVATAATWYRHLPMYADCDSAASSRYRATQACGPARRHWSAVKALRNCMSRRPTETTRGMPAGRRSKTVVRPSGSFAVVTRPAGL